MATQSTPPMDQSQVKTENPDLETAKTTMEGQHDANPEASKEDSPTSVFVNSEPMREEQVQNAMKFLSHPKVRGSPVMYRRSFLERKGLTKEEIDEAFRRVPDPPPTVSSGQSADTSKDGQLKSPSNMQSQALTQTLQPAPAPPPGVISRVGTFTPYRFRWSHAFLAIGFLAVSGAGTAVLFKNAIVPRLKSWVRKVVLEEKEEEGDRANKTSSKPSLEEETAAAAKAAAAAAADAARVSQDMLISKTEEKKCFEELMKLLVVQVQEMKSMSNSIRKLEVRSSSPVASAEQAVAPYPKSYMEPREVGHTQHSSSYAFRSQDGKNGLNYDVLNDGIIKSNGNTSSPWSQQRNARVTEIETEHEPKTGFSGGLTNELPVQRSWVPPRPPPFAMPEAAAAIRQPKKSLVQTEELSTDQLVTDELQRITKISESGGSVEVNGRPSKPNTSEIQEEYEAVE